jgi:hypothetical protein
MRCTEAATHCGASNDQSGQPGLFQTVSLYDVNLMGTDLEMSLIGLGSNLVSEALAWGVLLHSADG